MSPKRPRNISLPENIWKWLKRHGNTVNAQVLNDLQALQAIEEAAVKHPEMPLSQALDLIRFAQNGATKTDA